MSILFSLYCCINALRLLPVSLIDCLLAALNTLPTIGPLLVAMFIDWTVLGPMLPTLPVIGS